MRKAQGLSINVIIVAAIALVVLVVLIAIFTGRMSIFGSELSEQNTGTATGEEIEGDWLDPVSCEEADRTPFYQPLKDREEYSEGGTKVCCLRE